MSNDVKSNSVPEGGDALKSFQLTTEGVKDKSSKDYGLAISRYINSTTAFGSQGYYFDRNARFIKNRNYANGRIDIQAMYQDRFQFNGKTNYIALNWNALQIVNRIITGLVGRWMKRKEKVQIKAIDSLSQTEKQEEYEQLEFIIENREQLEALQKESGVPLIPTDELPEDKEALNIWRAEMQRLPEEILNEMGCNDVLSSNGWFDVMKEKMLHDSAETFFVGTYTWMDTQGVIHVEIVKPENAIYSYPEQNDLRDTSWRGVAPNIKISELRRRWGKEFNPDNPFALDEKELWEIAQKCKEYSYQTNMGWNDMWYSAFLRPYDEWNIRSIQFEIKTVDSDPYTVTKSKSTGTTYTQKGMPITVNGKNKVKPSVNQNIIGDTNHNIYRGVFLPDCDKLLEWGRKENMITPQDPKEIGNAEFSYSFVMPQVYLGRNLAIPEKIEAAVDGMILACLKIQQDIATAIPPGWVIDETALQNIDYGLGNDNNSIDHAKLFFQTGKIYYRGLDAEGNRVPVPIQEIANSGFAAHVQAFATTYQFWYQTLKDELGEDPNLIAAAIQPRVTSDNVETSQLQAEYATDVYYRAYAECMKQTARKISCLLKDSVTYGAQAYNHILKKEDVDDRIFSTEVRFLPTDLEVQRFEAMLNQAITASPDLIMFLDPFKLIRVAKEDVKLAELLYRQATRKQIAYQQQTARENQEATFKAQVESGKAAEEAKGKNIEMELDLKGKMEESKALADNKNTVLKGVFELAKIMATPVTSGEGQTATPGKVSPELETLISLAIKNIAMPLAVENKQMVNGVVQEQQQEQQAQQQFNQPQVAA